MSHREIRRFDDINYDKKENVKFEASIVKIHNIDRYGGNIPLAFEVALENGDTRDAVTWNTEELDTLIKDMEKGILLGEFYGMGRNYENKFTNQTTQLVVDLIHPLTKESEIKKQIIPNYKSQSEMRSELEYIIKQVENPHYVSLLTDLLLNNDNFYKWPAARSLHHEYEGGLFDHTVSVARLASSMSSNYVDPNNSLRIDSDLLVTGALLHDVGKLVEYSVDGEFTKRGNLLGHITEGLLLIERYCVLNNIPSNDDDIVLLKHLIASHHGQREFGSPVTPRIIEAYILSQADDVDAKMESIRKEFVTTGDYEWTKKMFMFDGSTFYKK